MSRLDKLEPDLFLDGPCEYLVKTVVQEMLDTEQWKVLFGDSIYPYERMDFSIRELPGMRLYILNYTKESESWFVNGDIICDVILPPEIRRDELEQVPSTIASALLQQFRRTTFFNNVSSKVPGLNELGKVFRVDKSLAFEWGEEIVPIVQITLNFRLDLRVWDLYLEESGRTKDRPFEVTLGTLKRIITEIRGMKDDNTTVDPKVGINQEV